MKSIIQNTKCSDILPLPSNYYSLKWLSIVGPKFWRLFFLLKQINRNQLDDCQPIWPITAKMKENGMQIPHVFEKVHLSVFISFDCWICVCSCWSFGTNPANYSYCKQSLSTLLLGCNKIKFSWQYKLVRTYYSSRSKF